MTEQEKELFMAITRQVIDWMYEEWTQLASYCPQCRYPELCEDHQSKKNYLDSLAKKFNNLLEQDEGKKGEATAKKTGGKQTAAKTTKKTAAKIETKRKK